MQQTYRVCTDTLLVKNIFWTRIDCAGGTCTIYFFARQVWFFRLLFFLGDPKKWMLTNHQPFVFSDRWLQAGHWPVSRPVRLRSNLISLVSHQLSLTVIMLSVFVNMQRWAGGVERVHRSDIGPFYFLFVVFYIVPELHLLSCHRTAERDFISDTDQRGFLMVGRCSQGARKRAILAWTQASSPGGSVVGIRSQKRVEGWRNWWRRATAEGELHPLLLFDMTETFAWLDFIHELE